MLSTTLDSAWLTLHQTAAANALPKDLVDETEFDYMRASGLLALTALQNGQPMVMRQYFSRTHALALVPVPFHCALPR